MTGPGPLAGGMALSHARGAPDNWDGQGVQGVAVGFAQRDPMGRRKLRKGEGMSVGVAIGLCFGVAIMAAAGPLGLVAGVAIGVAVGAALERSAAV